LRSQIKSQKSTEKGGDGYEGEIGNAEGGIQKEMG
jgi:hypothetical protein